MTGVTAGEGRPADRPAERALLLRGVDGAGATPLLTGVADGEGAPGAAGPPLKPPSKIPTSDFPTSRLLDFRLPPYPPLKPRFTGV